MATKTQGNKGNRESGKGTRKSAKVVRKVRSVLERYGARLARLTTYDIARVLATLALHFHTQAKQIAKYRDSDAEVQKAIRAYAPVYDTMGNRAAKLAGTAKPYGTKEGNAREDITRVIQVRVARRNYWYSLECARRRALKSSKSAQERTWLAAVCAAYVDFDKTLNS